MIEALRKLVAIPSITGAPAEEGMPFGKPVHDALLCALDLCDSFGFKTKNCSDYLGWAEIGEGEELMGILCHLDVVPTGSDWKHPPFAGEIEDGKIYGRGVVDDKGPAVAAIYAMKDIADSGKKLNCRIRIIFGCQEEDGDWLDMDYYKEHEEIPSFGFTPDADFPTIYGEKGIVMVKMSVPAAGSGFTSIKGGDAPNMVADWAKAVLDDGTVLRESGKAAHGSTPEEGENAITKLMEKAAAKGNNFAKFYMDKIGWKLDGSDFGIGFSDEASGGLSFNVGKISMDENAVYTEMDIRYPVTFKCEDVLASLKKEAKDDAEFTVITEMAPVYMDKNGPVITKLMEAYKQITKDDSEPQVMGGGTYARAMENIVAFGPLFPGRECTEHQKDEYIYLEDLEKAREIYRLAMEKLACE